MTAILIVYAITWLAISDCVVKAVYNDATTPLLELVALVLLTLALAPFLALFLLRKELEL